MEIAVSIFFVCGGVGVFILGLSAMWFGWQEHKAHKARKDAHVEAACKWAESIAADDSHGYDQGNRNGPDYDCSSFGWLHYGG